MQQEKVSERLGSEREIPSTSMERLISIRLRVKNGKKQIDRYHNLNTFVIVMIVVIDLIYEVWRKIEEFFFRFYGCSRLTCFVVKYYSEREIYSSNIWVESFFIFFFFAALSNTRVLFFKFQINYWKYFIKDRFKRRSGSLVKYFIYRSMK